MTDPRDRLDAALRVLPLVAILRGLTPAEVPAIGRALVAAGWAILEVPLEPAMGRARAGSPPGGVDDACRRPGGNGHSPQPLDSIAALAQAHPLALVGAGTVLHPARVRDVHAAGGRLVVSPHSDAAVIAEALRLGMVCLPGVATPTEAFAALAAGATGLKLFPAEMLSPTVLRALRTVLPAGVPLLPVGGVGAEHLPAWRAAGATGAGIGSSLYRPGDAPAEVEARARRMAAAWLGA